MLILKPKVARSVQANAGLMIKYRRRLLDLIDEMTASTLYWTQATYRDAPPRVAALVAQDAAPSKEINKQLQQLARRWQRKFDEAAPKIAAAYLKSQFAASDVAMRAALRDAGFAVKFELTPAMNDAFQASLAENIGLIKSIPQEYLQQVGGAVNRAYTSGRDLQTMVRDIKALYPKAADRAVLIARDQSNKANAVVNRTRQMQLGITDAIWMHSHAGKHPRPSHVAANGKQYKIAQGCLIDGEYIQPGQEINCRCTSRPVLPTL